MTAREKILNVEQQVRSMIDAGGVITDFHCPFCNLDTRLSQTDVLCCDEAAETIHAILDHVEHLERCEVVEKAMNRLEDMKAAITSALVN